MFPTVNISETENGPTKRQDGYKKSLSWTTFVYLWSPPVFLWHPVRPQGAVYLQVYKYKVYFQYFSNTQMMLFLTLLPLWNWKGSFYTWGI